ncbi:iron chelate uptake ABC transporter family permease subunit [Neisseria sp. Ec49-e6-T10]|uniref:iron chelate uptake ABC transporter family permease subunit n=1 Tax=Neisseria sp. Ec49-e6-T10 TaxID=3140744 RepID=UPI003EB74386
MFTKVIKCLSNKPLRNLLIMSVVALLMIMLFLLVNLQGNLNYVLTRRVITICAMILVAFAAGVSTVIFQSVTNNRILSPSIMGFEALFVLIQTTALFVGGEEYFILLDPNLKFIAETMFMVVFSLVLYHWLFNIQHNNLYLILLVGIICGSLFNSLASFMQRLLNPNEFAILQGRMFARFASVEVPLLIISFIVIGVLAFIIWRLRYRIDVIALGRNTAITLGLSYRKNVSILLIIVSILVSVSTALVGPMTFFGFLVASLAYQLIGSYQHRLLLPAAFLLGVIALVGGQLILQHIFDMAGTLSVVINFIGGMLFLVLLLKKASL